MGRPQQWCGELVVEAVGGRSVATTCFCRYPLKLMLPSKVASSDVACVWAYVITYGGGIVAGDRVLLAACVKDNATAVLASQASTKIFRSPTGLPARQLISASVLPGALLAVLPEPVTCFHASRYEQLQTIRVAPRGSLLLVDWLTSGRRDRGEVWAMDCYESCNRVFRGSAEMPVVLDKVRLAANAVVPPGTQLQGIHVLATIIVMGPRTESLREHLRTAVARMAAVVFNPKRTRVQQQHGQQHQYKQQNQSFGGPSAAEATATAQEAQVWASCSDMGEADLLIVRLASTKAESMYAFLAAHLAPILPQIGCNPYLS
eukprot:TRINITY_DN10047_c1_g1_i1.p1 TRINITY_DN10047_c1_g1~~TRINITY_DN10047_c1_g1_i1.p1  ORF type:complete len:365 (-),score=14.14 TRINITY_DN10047_c1_g1_i1:93-1046(-)